MYITKDSYFLYSGIDLEQELKSDDNDNQGKTVEIFINRVESFFEEYCNLNYETAETFDSVAYTKALNYQIDYIRKNGDLGFEQIAPRAYNVLKLSAMANPITQSRRYGNRYIY